MRKRIAVLAREDQAEALRVAVGLTLLDGRVEVYILDRAPATDPETRRHLEALADAGAPVFTNVPGGVSLRSLPNSEIARRILACDHVVAY